MNTPNKITLFRIILIPVFVVIFLFQLTPYPDEIALAIFAIASFSDFLDGYLARKHNQVTDFGKLMDPIADKLLVSIALICFVELRDSFPAWCAIVIITREFVISGFRQLAADKGVIIQAGLGGKVKTVVQLFMCLFYIIEPVMVEHGQKWFAVGSMVLMYAATALTVISLIDYLVRNWKILKISW